MVKSFILVLEKLLTSSRFVFVALGLAVTFKIHDLIGICLGSISTDIHKYTKQKEPLYYRFMSFAALCRSFATIERLVANALLCVNAAQGMLKM